MAGGKGLDVFRSAFLSDSRLSTLVDYPVASELFPGVEIKGGVCYFLWEADHNGGCKFEQRRSGVSSGVEVRDLAEFDVFIRDGRGVEILKKVLPATTDFMPAIMSGQNPFGMVTNFANYRRGEKKPGDLKLFRIESGKRLENWVEPRYVQKGQEYIKKPKILVPKAGSDGGQKIPDIVLGKSIIAGSGSVCTQSYLVIGPFETKAEAESCESYLKTRFFRFLVSLRKITQDAMRGTYTWVPQQKWDRTWTDAELYKKYGITADEQAYIEAMIKEMPA
jgi:site-specific DNA-methyltransferase (adenine-specific)